MPSCPGGYPQEFIGRPLPRDGDAAEQRCYIWSSVDQTSASGYEIRRTGELLWLHFLAHLVFKGILPRFFFYP
jgi:hypothetical protein